MSDTTNHCPHVCQSCAGWIPVSERLPEDSFIRKPMWVTFRATGQSGVAEWWHSKAWFFNSDIVEVEEVLAWMPIQEPPPYKEEV